MATKKTAVATRSKTPLVTFSFGITGSEPSTKKVPAGTTVGDVVKKLSLQGQRMLVNGNKASDSEVLRDGDTLTAAAPVKGGRN